MSQDPDDLRDALEEWEPGKGVCSYCGKRVGHRPNCQRPSDRDGVKALFRAYEHHHNALKHLVKAVADLGERVTRLHARIEDLDS